VGGRWVPRLTWGTSLFARLHVLRATAELSRAYAARAALGELDKKGKRQRQMVDAFRASIRPARVRPLIFTGVVAVFLVGSLLVTGVAQLASGALGWVSPDLDSITRVRQVLDRLAAGELSGGSLTGILNDLRDADAATRALLVLTLLAAVYVVCRPLFPAFRVKRVLWNLADEPAEALRTTVPSWHVPRATGLYARERRVLSTEGCSRVSQELPLDVLLSAMLTLVLGGLYIVTVAVDPNMRSYPINYIFPLGPALLRLSWLTAMVRGRSGRSDPLPSRVRLPVTGRVAVARRPEPDVALGLLFILVVPVVLVLYRQARVLQAVLAEDAAQRRTARRTAPRPLLALAALVAGIPLFTWLLLTVRGARLLLAGGRGRSVVLLLAVLASGPAAVPFLFVAGVGTAVWDLTFVYLHLVGPVSLGICNVVLAQRLREVGSPLPCSGEAPERDRAVAFAAPPGWPTLPAGWLPEPGWRPDSAWPAAPARWRFLRPANQHAPGQPVGIRLPDRRREATLPDLRREPAGRRAPSRNTGPTAPALATRGPARPRRRRGRPRR
jgi:hypothetical protein